MIDKEFMDKLREKYIAEQHGDENWAKENDKVRIILKELKNLGLACNIAILGLFFACSFQNFISRQYSADGGLH